MLVLLHKMVFIKNEAALLCVTMRERARKFAASKLLPLQSSVSVVKFSNAFWHVNETFPKVVLRMKLFLSL